VHRLKEDCPRLGRRVVGALAVFKMETDGRDHVLYRLVNGRSRSDAPGKIRRISGEIAFGLFNQSCFHYMAVCWTIALLFVVYLLTARLVLPLRA